MHERIFEPLGMKDTGFSVPAGEARPVRYQLLEQPHDWAGSEIFDAAAGGKWSKPPAFPLASGGLVSTIDDYTAFAQMLLNFGKHGNQRIVCRGLASRR